MLVIKLSGIQKNLNILYYFILNSMSKKINYTAIINERNLYQSINLKNSNIMYNFNIFLFKPNYY